MGNCVDTPAFVEGRGVENNGVDVDDGVMVCFPVKVALRLIPPRDVDNSKTFPQLPLLPLSIVKPERFQENRLIIQGEYYQTQWLQNVLTVF